MLTLEQFTLPDLMAITLSNIEIEILKCLEGGMQSKEIAIHVGRRKPTVEGHVRMLMAKLGARSRAQLVANAIKLRLL
jgi:DNA-binding CsgD family transcriptional regulator